jgi:large subunit ribosomal protein LP0
MVGTRAIPQKKVDLCERFVSLFRKYPRFALVTAENVTATQLLHIRHDLGADCELAFGKNSLMRQAVDELSTEIPELCSINDHLVNGAGICFTNAPFQRIKEVLDANRIGSRAKAGAIAPVDVVITPMRTSLDPNKVSVLHALNIQSKIFKGTIEITSQKLLFKRGDKVGASEANLLGILGIQPFQYTLNMEKLYDNGNIYDPAVLEISESRLAGAFANALRAVAALSLAVGSINDASVPHLVRSAFANVASVAVALEIPLREIAGIQAILADPEALARMQQERIETPVVAQVEPEQEDDGEEVVALGGFEDLFA